MIETVILGLSDEELTVAYFERVKAEPEKMSALADQYSDMQGADTDEEGNHGEKPF